MNYEILKAPVITEKTQSLAANNVFVFKVDAKANKVQIKQAIEEKFGVKVEKINTLNTKSKKKRVGRYTGRTKTYKKAIVKLSEDSTLEM